MNKLILTFLLFFALMPQFAMADTSDAISDEKISSDEAVGVAEPDEEKSDPNGWYGGAKVGISAPYLYGSPGEFGSTHFTTYNLGLSAGYDFGVKTPVPLRLEADFTFRGGDALRTSVNFDDRIEIRSFSTFMLQGWLDLPISKKFKPYVGGGGGAASMSYRVQDKTRTGDDEHKVNEDYDLNWAWMLGGGAGIKFDGWVLDLGYRFVKTKEYKTDFGFNIPKYKFRARSHDFHLGVRLYF